MTFHTRGPSILATAAIVACMVLWVSAPAFGKAADAGPAFAAAATPAELGQGVASTPKSGDTPANYPGATRAPAYTAPRTIQIVQPERTVVRDVDEALPLVLSGVAVLFTLGSFGLVIASSNRRLRFHRTH
jgi:hypothetical protein